MRVQSKKDPGSLASAARNGGTARVTAKGEKDFPDVLQKYEPAGGKDSLGLLLKKLDEIGERLMKSFSVYDLKEYKDTLRNFLKDTMASAYALREETGWTGRGRHKKYQLVLLVDQELEELSKLVFAKQKNQLKLMEKLGAIRGLLIDLYS